MRSLFSLLFFVFASSISYTQILNPVSWEFELLKEDGYYVISATADIEDPWVVYSHYTEEGGPIETTLEIDEQSQGVTRVGEIIEEGTMIKEFSKLFDLDVSKFKKTVTLKQKVKIDSNTKMVKGYITFMTCDNKRCLPPKDVDFSLKVK